MTGPESLRAALAAARPRQISWLQNTAVERGNVNACDNAVTGAAAGAYATNHYSPLACSP
jgi:hypothetical protein